MQQRAERNCAQTQRTCARRVPLKILQLLASHRHRHPLRQLAITRTHHRQRAPRSRMSQRIRQFRTGALRIPGIGQQLLALGSRQTLGEGIPRRQSRRMASVCCAGCLRIVCLCLKLARQGPSRRERTLANLTVCRHSGSGTYSRTSCRFAGFFGACVRCVCGPWVERVGVRKH